MTLPSGKLPAEMLAQLLEGLPRRDPRVLLGPGIGRDAAVIDFGDRLLVATTDPITFATAHLGWYAVHVNANDIVCMGARPAWLLATALLPEGAETSLPALIFRQLSEACDHLNIELVGGHTEVTPAVERPVIVGTMLGEATREGIVLGENIAPGDRVLMTKRIAIEGTSLLARECGDTLRGRRVDAATLGRASEMLFDPGISVVADARAVCGAATPRLMHDPTEGGLATALHELAEAAGVAIRVRRDAVPVLAETRTICDALALDPWGLLASGTLLAIVAAEDCGRVAAALADVKIECSEIGTIETGDPKVIIDDEAAPLPRFARDELARFFERSGR